MNLAIQRVLAAYLTALGNFALSRVKHTSRQAGGRVCFTREGPPLTGRFKAPAAPPVVWKIYGLVMQHITERIVQYINSRWKLSGEHITSVIPVCIYVCMFVFLYIITIILV